MQTVLSIDASVKPAQALVVQIRDKDVSILEQHFVPADSDEAFLQNLQELPKQIQTRWNNAILFIPGKDHMSLNLALPFKDDKQLNKVIGLEVQDQVPFDLDSFTVHHRHVGSLNGSGEDVHVGILPSSSLQTLLTSTKSAGLDPFIVSTPGSSLQGLYEFHGETLAENAAIVLEHPDTVYLGICIGKKLVLDRSLSRHNQNDSMLNASIELAIKNAEDRYHVVIPTVYHLSDDTTPTFVGIQDREVKTLSIATLFPHVTRKASVVALVGAVFAQDFPAPQILTNFRTGEFTYSPSLSALLNGFRSLLPYIATVLLIGLIGLGTWYTVRQHQISALQENLQGEILKVVPNFSAEPGQEAPTLDRMSAEVQNSLKEIGSPLIASPLDVLSTISEELAAIEGATTRRVTIRNGEARIEGTIPDSKIYKTLEKLEAAFTKKHGKIFCKAKSETPGTGSRDNARDFQITLGLCE